MGAPNYQNHHSANILGSSHGGNAPAQGDPHGGESLMGLMGGGQPAGGMGGGVGKMQHSPIKPPVVHQAHEGGQGGEKITGGFFNESKAG